MGAIEQLEGVNFIEWLIIGLLILSAIIAIYKIICEFLSIIGKPIGVMKQRKDDHELLVKTVVDLKELHDKHEEDAKQSIRHDEIIREDLQTLTNTINEIIDRLDVMQNKIDATEMAKLKDKILGYYRKYKDIGEWEHFEADTFWGLYDRYISHGGNSFVKHDIEPIMRDLRVKKF